MTSVRLDKVLMSSLHESFKNYKTETFSLVLSGTVPAAGTLEFSHTVSYSRPGSIADVYVQKQGVDKKYPALLLWDTPDFTDSSGNLRATTYVQYTPTSVIVTISVGNQSLSSTAISSQTYNLSVVIFDAPIAN